MPRARDIAAKVAHAKPGRIARWIAGRLRHGMHRGFWHASRLRMRVYDAIGGPRRLPPGSLGASCARDAATNDRFYLEQLRRHGPIFKLFWGSGHLKVCVVGFPLARRLLTLHRGVVRPETTDITSLVPAEYLRSMSPELHPKYRRLFKGAFRDDLYEAWEPELRDVMRRELANLAEPAAPESSPAKRLYAALDSIAMKALLAIVFGVRPDAEVAPILEASYRRLGPEGHIAQVGPEQAAARSHCGSCSRCGTATPRASGTASSQD